jgi:hypothetical protein
MLFKALQLFEFKGRVGVLGPPVEDKPANAFSLTDLEVVTLLRRTRVVRAEKKSLLRQVHEIGDCVLVGVHEIICNAITIWMMGI